MVYTNNRILFSLKTEGNSDTFYNRDEPWGPFAKWNKPVTKMQRLYDSSIFYEVPGVFIETERRIMVVRGYGENGELSFNGYSISVWGDERVL